MADGVSEKRATILDNEKNLLDFLIDLWRRTADKAVREKDFFAAAISGGRTPEKFYRALAAAPGLPWEKTHIFLADERFVPENNPESNLGMIRKNLLSLVPLPSFIVHPIPTDLPFSDIAASRYEEELRSFFSLPTGAFPRLDLILLGIGEDGHTASLFPGADVLNEEERLVVAVPGNGRRRDRITLTLPVINHAAHVVFYVTGIGKAPVIKRIMAGDEKIPAALVRPERGELHVVLDSEAGSLIGGGMGASGGAARRNI